MEWHYSGRYDRFRYVRVDKYAMRDKEILEDIFIPGGSIEYNALSSLKASGSIPFIRPPDLGVDYLRIYATHSLRGAKEEELLGTFRVATPASVIRGETQVGDAGIYSLLQILQNGAPRNNVCIPAGTPCIQYAVNAIRDLGLSVYADTSTATLNTPANYKAGTRWIEIINDLCTIAGFDTANVDSMGNIRLYAYTDPANKRPTVEFVSDASCVFQPEIQYEFDIADVPNVVIANVENEKMSMTAVAENRNPSSVYSIPVRGMEVVYEETVSDIDDMTALQSLADRRLAEKTSAVESIIVPHTYKPYSVGEVARFVYRKAKFEFEGAAVKKTVNFVAGMPCEARFRRFVRG